MSHTDPKNSVYKEQKVEQENNDFDHLNEELDSLLFESYVRTKTLEDLITASDDLSKAMINFNHTMIISEY